jgi:3-keto-L-gulonate-6-phosphate decarboxylase
VTEEEQIAAVLDAAAIYSRAAARHAANPTVETEAAKTASAKQMKDRAREYGGELLAAVADAAAY